LAEPTGLQRKRTIEVSRISLTAISLGLLLCGSAVAQPLPYPPPPVPVPVPGYPPPPGYAAPPAYPGQPYVGPDGLTYVNGVPVYYAYGSYLPLVFVAGLGWGYYGPGHHWFGAPVGLRGRLDHFYPGGRGFPARGPGRPDFHDRGRDHDHR
jgi:hypothetical protein